MSQFENYTDAQLELLLDDLEADNAERKESWSDDAKDKGRQAVCAFANDLPNYQKPGVLFVGAKDDGTPSGLEISDKLLQTLADIKTDGQTLPPPTIIVQKRTLKNKDMAVVFVLPADTPPVRYKGRVWIRTGPRRGIATTQDERILNEKRRYKDKYFDSCTVSTSSLQDINRVLFEHEFLPNAFAKDVLEANQRSYEERLASLKMIEAVDNPIPTVLGLLVLGKNPRHFLPGAYVQFLRINGLGLADPIVDSEEIDGPIGQIIWKLDAKMTAHNRVAVDITSASLERRNGDYSMVALQQLTRNALMHRSFEGTNAPVRVYWYNDRIEIINPGGPYGEVTVENFGQPGITDYRNRNLADAMKVSGFVQRFGAGISIARRELEKNGNPPIEFEVQPTVIICTVRKRK